MNREIRVLGGVLMGCFALLFVQLNIIQVLRADEYNEHPGNTRLVERDFNGPRGTISTADGVLVAESQAVDGGRFEHQRVYPEGDLYAHSVGYFSFQFGSTGVERTYNDDLSGQSLQFDFRRFGDLFTEQELVGDVTLTLDHRVQTAAREALGDRPGSVVALDPRTGAVLALWSTPSYDPNAVATNDPDAARFARDLLVASEANPLLARSYQERFPPGSTFKVVTAAAGLQSGLVTEDEPSYPVESEYVPPQTTRPLRNFGGSSCGGTLFEILAVSCNTAFARMGIDVGGGQFVSTAQGFGFNDAPPIDIPSPAQSVVPTDFERDQPALAQSAIGQNDVQATPLQMALVAAAVANGGSMMTPHVMAEIRDPDGEVVEEYEPTEWLTPLSADHADVARRAMIGVVEDGTASGLAISGVEVGGKTGTAQRGTDPPSSHAWIIGFAGPPGGEAEVAVAVLVEAQVGVNDDQTGGRVAAPIARAVIEAALGR